jgi:hypothetical protein
MEQAEAAAYERQEFSAVGGDGGEEGRRCGLTPSGQVFVKLI